MQFSPLWAQELSRVFHWTFSPHILVPLRKSSEWLHYWHLLHSQKRTNWIWLQIPFEITMPLQPFILEKAKSSACNVCFLEILLLSMNFRLNMVSTHNRLWQTSWQFVLAWRIPNRKAHLSINRQSGFNPSLSPLCCTKMVCILERDGMSYMIIHIYPCQQGFLSHFWVNSIW